MGERGFPEFRCSSSLRANRKPERSVKKRCRRWASLKRAVPRTLHEILVGKPGRSRWRGRCWLRGNASSKPANQRSDVSEVLGIGAGAKAAARRCSGTSSALASAAHRRRTPFAPLAADPSSQIGFRLFFTRRLFGIGFLMSSRDTEACVCCGSDCIHGRSFCSFLPRSWVSPSTSALFAEQGCMATSLPDVFA